MSSAYEVGRNFNRVWNKTNSHHVHAQPTNSYGLYLAVVFSSLLTYIRRIQITPSNYCFYCKPSLFWIPLINVYSVLQNIEAPQKHFNKSNCQVNATRCRLLQNMPLNAYTCMCLLCLTIGLSGRPSLQILYRLLSCFWLSLSSFYDLYYFLYLMFYYLSPALCVIRDG